MRTMKTPSILPVTITTTEARQLLSSFRKDLKDTQLGTPTKQMAAGDSLTLVAPGGTTLDIQGLNAKSPISVAHLPNGDLTLEMKPGQSPGNADQVRIAARSEDTGKVVDWVDLTVRPKDSRPPVMGFSNDNRAPEHHTPSAPGPEHLTAEQKKRYDAQELLNAWADGDGPGGA